MITNTFVHEDLMINKYRYYVVSRPYTYINIPCALWYVVMMNMMMKCAFKIYAVFLHEFGLPLLHVSKCVASLHALQISFLQWFLFVCFCFYFCYIFVLTSWSLSDPVSPAWRGNRTVNYWLPLSHSKKLDSSHSRCQIWIVSIILSGVYARNCICVMYWSVCMELYLCHVLVSMHGTVSVSCTGVYAWNCICVMYWSVCTELYLCHVLECMHGTVSVSCIGVYARNCICVMYWSVCMELCLCHVLECMHGTVSVSCTGVYARNCICVMYWSVCMELYLCHVLECMHRTVSVSCTGVYARNCICVMYWSVCTELYLCHVMEHRTTAEDGPL